MMVEEKHREEGVHAQIVACRYTEGSSRGTVVLGKIYFDRSIILSKTSSHARLLDIANC
jgi:hypothetical protein